MSIRFCSEFCEGSYLSECLIHNEEVRGFDYEGCEASEQLGMIMPMGNAELKLVLLVVKQFDEQQRKGSVDGVLLH